MGEPGGLAAGVYGVAQSLTRLKQLRSSSMRSLKVLECQNEMGHFHKFVVG